MTSCYLSTGYFANNPIEKTIANLEAAGFTNFEISGGKINSSSLTELKKYKNMGINFLLHNYCLTSKNENFVLNLGSENDIISQMSERLIRRSLQVSSELEAAYYAIHAPFCIDPNVSHLGKGFPISMMKKHSETIKLFSDRINNINKYAQRLGVKLAVENNVYSAVDHAKFGEVSPFVGTGTDINLLFENVDPNVGLLLDLGHLKVSSTSMHFNLVEAFKSVSRKISGYHFSDNNGLRDANEPFDMLSWFIDLTFNREYPRTLEVYSTDFDLLHDQLELMEAFDS